MHMSDKATTTLKQTHGELGQGQPPFLTKLWTLSVWLKAAPMNNSPWPQQALQRQPHLVIWKCDPWASEGGSPATWGKRQGQRSETCSHVHHWFPFLYDLGKDFLWRLSPGLKIFNRKTTGLSNSIFLMKKQSAREVRPIAKLNHGPHWRHKWDEKNSSASRTSFLSGDPKFLRVLWSLA